jgi:flavin-dependent dehydrogenase
LSARSIESQPGDSVHTSVLVVGGGPAGATAAHLLSAAGFGVTVLERATFPRYHIGESLQPSCVAILDRVGMRETLLSRGFVKKYGVYNEWGSERWAFEFSAIPAGEEHAFQVVRSEFDKLLLDNARAAGAAVFEGAEAVGLEWEGDRPVRARWRSTAGGDEAERTITFDLLIDASGRTGLIANQSLKNRRFNEGFQNVAVWAYWRGAQPLSEGPAGATAISSVSNGWLWLIPLHDGTLSLGLVTHRDEFKKRRAGSADLVDLYLKAVAESPLAARLTVGAERVSDLRVEQEFSYASTRFSGPGYFLAGDAACFIDPLLSTGVHLAMYSALLAASSAASLLRGEVSEAEVIPFYDRSYRLAYLRILVLVASFYQLYDGKDAYFWKAQQLANADLRGAVDNAAFISIVAGHEDVRDAADPSRALTARMGGLVRDVFTLLSDPDRVEKVAAMSPQELSAVLEQGGEVFTYTTGGFSVSPEDAVEDLYVAPGPALGLLRSATVEATAVTASP